MAFGQEYILSDDREFRASESPRFKIVTTARGGTPIVSSIKAEQHTGATWADISSTVYTAGATVAGDSVMFPSANLSTLAGQRVRVYAIYTCASEVWADTITFNVVA